MCLIAAFMLGCDALEGRTDPPYMMLNSRLLTVISGMSSELLGTEKSQSFASLAV